MSTVAGYIQAVRRLLLGTHRPTLNVLDANITDSDATLALRHNFTGGGFGTYLGIDDEIVYVWSATGQTVTIERAMLGTTEAAHTAGTLIEVNPRFPNVLIRDESVAEIASWPRAIYRLIGVTYSLGAGETSVDLAGITGLIDVLRVYGMPVATTDDRWKELPFQVKRELPTVDFPSGTGLWLDMTRTSSSGFDLRVVASCAFDTVPFTDLIDLQDDVGLTESLEDAVKYGVAWRLLAGREVKRTFTEAQGEPRHADEVPPGHQMQTAEQFRRMRNQRLADEAARLAGQHGVAHGAMSITLLLSEPFYTGIGVTADTPYPYSVAIGGHGYFVDTKKMARSTIETIRQGFDSSGEPGEQSLSTEGVWKRWGDDWSKGAGQVTFDARDSDRSRYYTSTGIDPWGERGEIALLPITERKRTAAGAVLLLPIGDDYLYMTDGDATIQYTADPTPTSPSWTVVTFSAAVTSLCTDGTYIYAAVGTDIQRVLINDTTVAVFSTQNASVVAFANGRLLAGDGNDLYEIDNAGAATPLWSHFAANATIVSIVGSPTGIFVGLNVGETAEFLFVGFDTTSGNLAEPLPAGSLNRGETIYAMLYYQSLVALGTSRGLRVAEIVQDRGLAPGPVIETPAPVRALDAEAEYLWFSGGSDAANTYIFRANLARPTTHPNVPAYATDISTAVAAGTCQSIARFGDRTYFGVNANGAYGPTDGYDLVASGVIDSGWIRFGTVERLVLHNVDLYHEPLDGSIEVEVISEDGTATAVGESDVADSLAPLNLFSGQQIDSNALRVRLTLNRSSTTTLGPVLLRWILRAIVVPLQVERFIIPILLHSVVHNPNGDGQDHVFDVNAEFAYLKGLEASRQVVSYQMASETLLGTVRMVQVPEGGFRGFGDHRAYLDQTVNVHLMTLEV